MVVWDFQILCQGRTCEMRSNKPIGVLWLNWVDAVGLCPIFVRAKMEMCDDEVGYRVVVTR
jgi:hypothetical protein